MFERYTDRARRVVVLAQEEARMFNHNYIGTEHLLLGLIHEGCGVGAKALDSLGISLEAVRVQVEEIIGRQLHPTSGHIPFTERTKKVLELSLREALQLGHNYIGTEHILLGLIREGEGVGAQVLVKLGAELVAARKAVIDLLTAYDGGARPSPHDGWLGVAKTGMWVIGCTYCHGPIAAADSPGKVVEAVEQSGARLVAQKLVVCASCQERPFGELIDTFEATGTAPSGEKDPNETSTYAAKLKRASDEVLQLAAQTNIPASELAAAMYESEKARHEDGPQ